MAAISGWLGQSRSTGQQISAGYTLQRCMQPHLDTLHSYSMSHEPSDFLCWKPSSQPSADQTSAEKVVHTALQALGNSWDEFFELYDSSTLLAKPDLPL